MKTHEFCFVCIHVETNISRYLLQVCVRDSARVGVFEKSVRSGGNVTSVGEYSGRIALVLNNLQRLICHKTKKPNQIHT